MGREVSSGFGDVEFRDKGFQALGEDVGLLRDILAVDRTLLAAEQTMLAYLRTALCLVIAGASFIEALETTTAAFTGWLFIFSGIATFTFGVIHCRNESRRVRQLAVVNNSGRPHLR